MSLTLLVLLQAAAEPAIPPQQVASAWFSTSDYPNAAILLGQEGVVEARLAIATDGRATDCTIARSSGSPALDTATCSALKARARFRPALDSSGRPTRGTWTQEVHWMIEGNELPVAPWTIRLLAALDKKGTPTNCAIQAGGALKRDEFLIDCRELSGAFTLPADLVRRYAGHEAVLVFDQQFVPEVVNSIDTPVDLTRFPLVSREVLSIGIDRLGRVGACSQTKAEGDYKPSADGCAAMRARRFKPDTKGRATPIGATATTAIYAYVR
jgi:TonB family protein